MTVPPDSGQAVARAGNDALEAAARLDQPFLNWELSGLFAVSQVTNPVTLHVYVSSFLPDAITVQLQINKLVDSGNGKVTVLQTALPVPGMGAVEVALDADALGLKGATVEVFFQSPDPMQVFQLIPSVDAVQLFPADGATLPLLLIPPGGFARVFPDSGDAFDAQGEKDDIAEPPPPTVMTTGIFDVPQGVAAAIPQVTVILSSFSDQTLTADVVVNRLVRGSTQKETVLTVSVQVPPGEERQFNVENAEGQAIEVSFTLSRDEQGNSLQPSVDVTRRFTADDTVESLVLLTSGSMY